MQPSFVVPAEYFYALAANLPSSVTAETRYQMATLANERETRDQLRLAITAGTITPTTGRFRLSPTDPGTDPLVTPEQAARRLQALGTTTDLPPATIPTTATDDVNVLVTAWLAFNNPTPADDPADDIEVFWSGIGTSGQQAEGHLRLIVSALTGFNDAPAPAPAPPTATGMINALVTAGLLPPPLPTLPGQAVANLAAITPAQWRTFFHQGETPSAPGPNAFFLPPFTRPGTITEQVESFIRHLQQFFDLQDTGGMFIQPTTGGPPTFGTVSGDPLHAFFAAYGAFTLGAAIDAAAVATAAAAVFPAAEDARGREWLAGAVVAINDLFAVTAIGGLTPQQQFSLMEALYARGFVSKASITELTTADFTDALTGTVARAYAGAIFALAGIGTATPPAGPGSPTPINPDGTLVNCVPPDHLSPLGPVEYLHELLALAEESTCDAPDVSEGTTLASLVSGRRGPLGNLLVTRANLETPLLLIDLVNENLEKWVATGTPGVVYNTASDHLPSDETDHQLRNPDSSADQTFAHDPATLFAAIPEHSSPAEEIGQSIAYDVAQLRGDFSAPILPYSQPLDVCRSYLEEMRTSRFAIMRRFREAITEFALKPIPDPPTFRSQQWRFPVRFETAIEYLGINPEEASTIFGTPLSADDVLHIYGLPTGSSLDDVLGVAEFLAATGLTYCQLVELINTHREGLQLFPVDGESSIDPPPCEPCCLDDFTLGFSGEDFQGSMMRLAVFIRLWRKLQAVPTAQYSFTALGDIADVLGLFVGGAINPDFIRQLASFQMLRDEFHLPLVDDTDTTPGTGADRTHLLAIWVGPTARKFGWAVDQLLRHIRDHAQAAFDADDRPPEFLKVLADNLDALSLLAGFDPTDTTGATTWHGHPTSTLRFAEVLAKIFASEFGVGEIEFLFTTDDHVAGDDPFPLASNNETVDSPLDLPDDSPLFSLWALRRKLLDVQVPDEQIAFWSWARIDASLRLEFGFVPSDPTHDELTALGAHFFPTMVAACGCATSTDPTAQQYRVPLAATDTSAPMWNTPPGGPFQYDTTAQQLFTEVPLTDLAVLEKLSRVRQLRPPEQRAVQDLYFFPRAELARFAFIFPSFIEAAERLIQEPDESQRWLYFQRAFAFAHARARAIADHLAAHVGAVTGMPSDEGSNVAFTILRSLLADENKATVPWESDTGQSPEELSPPAITFGPQPNGGAFAALLGLVGTGLLGEMHSAKLGDGTLVWREVRGPMDAFGAVRNAWNAPQPTVLPAMDLTLTNDQLRFVGIHNGFAFQNDNAERLNGADGFKVTWTGVLLVEAPGPYAFQAGMPTLDGQPPGSDGTDDQRWRVTLTQGQRSWVVLSHNMNEGSSHPSRATPIPLRRGAYDITIEFEQCPPVFDRKDLQPSKTGFQLKYQGPDTADQLMVVPATRLYIAFKDESIEDGLDEGVAVPVGGKAQEFLHRLYVSSLRDVRRTYQRAYKATLFTRRLSLSVMPVSDDGQSELGYFLAHPDRFAGLSFFLSSGNYLPHLAFLDFNLLPVGDNYHPPDPTADQRAAPSVKRRQALFDWWERLFDYSVLRDAVRTSPSEPPVFLLFHEAAEMHPDDPSHLLRHLGVDLSHADLVQSYYENFIVSSADLEDEIWPTRIWHADRGIRDLLASFTCPDIRTAAPDLWASDDPSAVSAGATETGNHNLLHFVQNGFLENGEPRRYDDLQLLDDGLRERARAALIAYLTALGRVSFPAGMPIGGTARTAKDLAEILLIDVEAGLCQRASRIEEAIAAVQLFVQRARLGLEAWQPSVDFILLWDRRFADFRTWQACKRKDLYKENWIEWTDRAIARDSESFRLLEDQLRRVALSIASPAGLTTWPGGPGLRPPVHPGLQYIQAREPSVLAQLPPPSPTPPDGSTTREGFTLMGTPDRHGRPSWLASPSFAPANNGRLPYWIESAIRLGARFVRVAAAGLPMGARTYEGPAEPDRHGCCVECGLIHPPGVDEYYFWIVDSRQFQSQVQDADVVFPGVDPAVQTAWHAEAALPTLLFWPDAPLVHLYWARVHNGELKQLRRSREGVSIADPAPAVDLEFLGRFGDTLRFHVVGGTTPTLTGYPASPLPGFRYDMPTDTAEVLPEVVAGPDPALVTIASAQLAAFPFFAFFQPGAPLVPLSFFSQALVVAGVLRSHCRFEAALKWYEAFFNPLTGDAAWCPDSGGQGEGDGEGDGEGEGEGGGFLCCTGGNPVDDDTARRRSITLNHLETLLDWGDAVVRRNAPESFQRARLIFDAASKVLGARPRTVVDTVDTTLTPPTVASFAPNAPPLNPRLMSLYERVGDRVAMIHNCMNGRRLKNGVPNKDMPYFGDVVVRNGWQSTVNRCLDENDWCNPSCAYRFTFLIQKAIELASEVRGLGQELLAAYEKGDAEYLASLRASHERQLTELVIDVRQNQWRDADWQVQALQFTKQISQTKLRYFQGLIDVGLIGGELDYQSLTEASTATRAAGNISEGIAQIMQLIPDIYVGFPVSFTHLPVGTKLAGVFSAIARIANTVADILGSTAGLRLTQAGWDRRDAEWRNQVDVLNLEIQQEERQILGAERRRDVALRELNNQQRQSEQLGEVQDFLRDKFTSHELYLFLQRETAAIHRQMYELAFQTARQAQKAFNYERGHTTRDFLQGELWSDLHEGLLAGDRLHAALRRMDKAYIDENIREYELTKHVSLRQMFPQQLLTLKVTGSCEVELPEWLFDLDYPGQYMRRIRNVSLTIPSVVGPFSGVHCRLTLLSSTTRIDPRLNGPVKSCCKKPAINPATQVCAACGQALTLTPPVQPDPAPIQNGYPPLNADDPRIVRQYAALEAIATSTGQNDAGLFEVNFRDERYLPFEFAGAIGRYRIELPPENNFFDLSTVTDLILHLRYTAREGGDLLRRAATQSARDRLPDAGQRLLDVMMELPDVWSRLIGQPATEDKTLELTFDRDLFQFLPGQPDLCITRLEFLFAATDAVDDGIPSPATITVMLTLPIKHAMPDGAGDHDDDCPGATRPVDCEVSAEWPGLYHGAVLVDIEPIGVNVAVPATITVEFPGSAGAISRLFVLAYYDTHTAGASSPGAMPPATMAAMV